MANAAKKTQRRIAGLSDDEQTAADAAESQATAPAGDGGDTNPDESNTADGADESTGADGTGDEPDEADLIAAMSEKVTPPEEPEKPEVAKPIGAARPIEMMMSDPLGNLKAPGEAPGATESTEQPEAQPWAQQKYPGMPKDGIVMGPDEYASGKIYVRGVKVGDRIILSEPVYRGAKPRMSDSLVFHMVYGKGASIPAAGAVIVE